MTDLPELKPCPNPWCEHGNNRKPWVTSGGTWQVGCDCGFDGPPAQTEAEAIAAWNTRTGQLVERDAEPVAVRYDFDGYGYRYLDSGSGSDWLTRTPDAEPLYLAPQLVERAGVVGAIAEGIFREIEHGDQEHRAWLYAALVNSKTIAALNALGGDDAD